MPLSWNEIRDRSIAFVREWDSETSEHAEAKSFWDAFFQVFGVSRRRLAAFEKHVKKADGKDGFIDLFWPGMLLAEHKSRGKNLDSAYGQATDYFPGLSDKELPRYIIVSDFAHFRVRNLDTGQYTEFPLSDLPKNLTLFGFIAGYETRQYKEQDPVNVKAAQKLAELHDALKDVGYEGHELEVYLVRILFCLFADDTGIFMPRSAFEEFIRTRTSDDGSDLAPWLNQIFQTLNTPSEKRLKNLDEQIAELPYVNGRLFEEFLPQASFDRSMRETLLSCCELDWGSISPAIFGSLFQGIMNAAVRRNLGAHYTSEKNIQKVIGPLFLDDLWAEFERNKTQRKKLMAFHEKLGKLNFFDPACGCGNFLVISYRELRLLELEVIKKLYQRDQQQLSMDAIDQYVKVDVDQFHGIEIEEWPAQIARVAMWLIDHQMNTLVGETFGEALVRIPLKATANIRHDNALTLDWSAVLPAEKCDYLLGNPPFLGKKEQSQQQKIDFSHAMVGIPKKGILDFVSAWYVKAVRYVGDNATACALVSTNSVTQGEQVGALWNWMLGQGVVITFAHRTFRWSNEARGVAAVHCVIVGFSKHGKAKTIFDYDDVNGDPISISVSQINPYLVEADNVLLDNRRSPICGNSGLVYGSFALDGGHFTLQADEVADILKESPEAKRFIRKFVGGKELIRGEDRWCLWLDDANPMEIRKLSAVRRRVDAVQSWRKTRDRKTTRELADFPSRFAEIRQPSSDYLALPTVSSIRRRYIPIAMLSPDVIASNQVYVLPGASLYDLGVLTSEMHMAWLRSVGGRLKSDYRYSAGIVYNNFPWPIDALANDRAAIASAAEEVLAAREQFADASLADLYDPLSMPRTLMQAHRKLDKAVDKAYARSGGKQSWSTEAKRVAFLFGMHQTITSLPKKPKSGHKS